MVYCFTHSLRKVFSSPSRLAKVALGWRCHGPHGFEMAFLLWQQHWHLPRRCTFFRSRWWFWWGFLWMEKDGHWWKIYWSSTKIQTIYCSYCRLFNQKYQKFTRSSVAGGLPRLPRNRSQEPAQIIPHDPTSCIVNPESYPKYIYIYVL